VASLARLSVLVMTAVLLCLGPPCTSTASPVSPQRCSCCVAGVPCGCCLKPSAPADRQHSTLPSAPHSPDEALVSLRAALPAAATNAEPGRAWGEDLVPPPAVPLILAQRALRC